MWRHNTHSNEHIKTNKSWFIKANKFPFWIESNLLHKTKKILACIGKRQKYTTIYKRITTSTITSQFDYFCDHIWVESIQNNINEHIHFRTNNESKLSFISPWSAKNNASNSLQQQRIIHQNNNSSATDNWPMHMNLRNAILFVFVSFCEKDVSLMQNL